MPSQTTRQKPVGPALRRLMAEQDIRPEEIAFRVGVSASTVARWIRGSNQPDRGAGERLAAMFEVERKVFYEEAA